MALTASEETDTVFHAGYAAAGAVPAVLAPVLASLTTTAEARLRTRFLPALNAMEEGIAASVELVDTAKAAVFERNQHELMERAAGYHWQRVNLCTFLGVPPGPGCSLALLPPFSACCPRGGSGGGSGGGDTVLPGEQYAVPAIFAV